jgi:hypothetical protein
LTALQQAGSIAGSVWEILTGFYMFQMLPEPEFMFALQSIIKQLNIFTQNFW